MDEIEGTAKITEIWEYIDPKGMKRKPEAPSMPRISDYMVEDNPPDPPQAGGDNPSEPSQAGGATVTPPEPIERPAIRYSELFNDQRETYKQKTLSYKMERDEKDRIIRQIQMFDTAIKVTARSYIPSDEMKSTTRDILKLLSSRYERSNDEIVEQLFQQMQQLKTPPTKEKVESWMADWERLKKFLINRGMEGSFGSEIMFVKEFLKDGHM